MNILYILVPVALILAGSAVAAFAWAVRHGQFEDVHTPAIRILLDEDEIPRKPARNDSSGGDPTESDGIGEQAP